MEVIKSVINHVGFFDGIDSVGQKLASLALPVLLSAGCIMLTSNAAVASVVRAVTVADLVSQSALIFEGEVTGIKTHSNGANSMIHTLVTFQVAKVISGTLQNNPLVLSYMGGELDGKVLMVGGMTIPTVGEEGLFFVEQLGRTQVHPLTGWSQGHFLIRKDSTGKKRVFAANGLGVTALTQGKKDVAFKMSKGIAIGVKTVSGDDLDSVLSLKDFNTRLKNIMAENK